MENNIVKVGQIYSFNGERNIVISKIDNKKCYQLIDGVECIFGYLDENNRPLNWSKGWSLVGNSEYVAPINQE